MPDLLPRWPRTDLDCARAAAALMCGAPLHKIAARLGFETEASVLLGVEMFLRTYGLAPVPRELSVQALCDALRHFTRTTGREALWPGSEPPPSLPPPVRFEPRPKPARAPNVPPHRSDAGRAYIARKRVEGVLLRELAREFDATVPMIAAAAGKFLKEYGDPGTVGRQSSELRLAEALRRYHTGNPPPAEPDELAEPADLAQQLAGIVERLGEELDRLAALAQQLCPAPVRVARQRIGDC
jgi:hypothetical protein